MIRNGPDELHTQADQGEKMKIVEIYVGTDLRGPARGEGKTIYIMRTHMNNGKDHESKPAIRAAEDVTESRLVLLALFDALKRIKYACEVVIYTECTYIVASINNMWPAAWQKNDWKTARGQAKDSDLWQWILEELEESGHELRAVSGKHEFSNWMRCFLPGLVADRKGFSVIEPKELNLVSDRI